MYTIIFRDERTVLTTTEEIVTYAQKNMVEFGVTTVTSLLSVYTGKSHDRYITRVGDIRLEERPDTDKAHLYISTSDRGVETVQTFPVPIPENARW